MLLYVTVKNQGKRKPVLARRELVLQETPDNLQELITAIVSSQVKELADKQGRGELISVLTGGGNRKREFSGKIGFRTVYSDKPAEPEQAVEAAILAFEHGLYKVFLRGEACARLYAPLQLSEGDELVFISFTRLAEY